MIYKVIHVTGYRDTSHGSGYPLRFSQIVGATETPIECAKRRAKELYPQDKSYISTLTMTTEQETEREPRILNEVNLTGTL
jgi:hypothetical protein